ncbi:F-box/LRR-repeat protein At5g38396-like [Aegilops tauschii subsp. strangulata]|uniref:F-box/LRR-repeat protein At5g38396-like n=1 Tax=Aegilops tauschii subsp. strangulata TaxID=200361 RepID=UPI003CC856D5
MDNVAASEPKKRRRDEQGPPASSDGSDDAGLNLISRLPDEMLGTIISFLPIKGAAQTAILSSRWRHIWRSTPLNLIVDDGVSRNERKGIAVVSKILAALPGPACRFSSRTHLHRGFYTKLDGWFRSSALDGLEKLEFHGDDMPPLQLPPSAFRFAPTLRAIGIGRCNLSEINTATEMIPISFTASVRTVKVLVLNSVGHNRDVIIGFLRCFPCVEKLHIQGVSGHPGAIAHFRNDKSSGQNCIEQTLLSCLRIMNDMKIVQQYDMHDPIECLDLHLREIILNGYEGRAHDLNFARFFVLNARALKEFRNMYNQGSSSGAEAQASASTC